VRVIAAFVRVAINCVPIRQSEKTKPKRVSEEPTRETKNEACISSPRMGQNVAAKVAASAVRSSVEKVAAL